MASVPSSSRGENTSTSSVTAEEETPAAAMVPAPAKQVFPPGYRFVPTDEELIVEYLKRKINNEPIPIDQMSDVNLYRYNPQFLSETYPRLGESEWYFFTPRDRKYRNGQRPNRSAGNGYWKATGADKMVTDAENNCVGFRKALVFYEGKPPKGEKTNWIMHEYRIDQPPRNKRNADDMRLDDWVLCRIYMKAIKPEKNQNPEDVANAAAGDDHPSSHVTEEQPDTPPVGNPNANAYNKNIAPVLDSIPDKVENFEPVFSNLPEKVERVENFESVMPQDSSFHEYQLILMDPCFQNLPIINDVHDYDFGMSPLIEYPLGQQSAFRTNWGFQQDYNSNWGIQNNHVTTAAAAAASSSSYVTVPVPVTVPDPGHYSGPPSTSAFADSFIMAGPSTSGFEDSFIKSEDCSSDVATKSSDDVQARKRRR